MIERFAAADLPQLEGVVDRRTFLPTLAEGRRVLHLGCVDEGLTAERSGTGALLHEELNLVASDLVGVDLSSAGLKELGAIVPGSYVHGDVEHLGLLQLPACDLVIAAELIEHLGSPHLFYAELRRYLVWSGASAVLTTPNAHGWVGQLRFAVTRRELVHPDHVLVYTPTTLDRSLRASGLLPTGWWSHAWEREGTSVSARLRNVADRAALRWNPWLAPGIVVRVSPDPSFLSAEEGVNALRPDHRPSIGPSAG